MACAIEMKNICKQFKGSNSPALDHVSLTIEDGELVTILGTSGCGKTTLLKMINRLYEPDEGDVLLFGENISDMDATVLRRKIGYVIQQIGLFPHMSVKENIATVPKLLKWDKEKIDKRVDELMEMIGLPAKEYASRYPAQLSGGQQQRIGVARALAVNPQIMLLDEPFGALDSITRAKLQDELLQLHNGLKKTFLFVTHDIDEAFKMGTRVIVMNDGKIVRFDTPENIVRNPKDEFVSSLIKAARERESFWEKCI